MGAQQDETLPDMENRCNARTCKQQLTPSAELWKCYGKSRCKQYLTPSPKFRQPFWPDGQRCDRICRIEYRRDKALSTLLWFSTPRYLCPNSDLGWIALQAVQSVMNVSSAKLHRQSDVQSHGGIGQRVANKTAKCSKKKKSNG